MQNLNSHNFESTYKELKIDLNRLGCLMLDVKWPVGMWSPEFEGAGSDLYYAKNKDRFWINGWVADKAHLTLLYGFMKPAYKWKKYINRVLKGWKFPELEVEGMGRLAINVKDDLNRTWVRETRLEREQMGLPVIANQLTGKYAPH